MRTKDIQRSKFIIGCVCCASIIILLGSIGDNQREVISNVECFKKGFTGLFLLGLALLTNYILDKGVKKNDSRNHSSRYTKSNRYH